MVTCDEAIERLLKTLKLYVKSRGHQVITMTEIAGQDNVKIDCEALYWYHKHSGGGLLTDVLNTILEDKECEEKLRREYGIELVENEEATYLKVPTKLLKKLLEETSKEQQTLSQG